VSRYFDRINRPEQLITSLPAAIITMVGPIIVAQRPCIATKDVQTMGV